MKSTRNPFRINIGFLINQPIGYTRDIPFELHDIELGESLFLHELVGTITLIRNHDGFRAQAEFDGVVDNECGRCLENFAEKIHSDFEEFFTFPFVETSDDENPVPENGNVDFKPMIHDYLLMEVPINPVCREDCKGLCDICGVNLNNSTCEHVHDEKRKTTNNKNRDLDGAKQALKP